MAHFTPRKQLSEMGSDHTGEQHKSGRPIADACRQWDQTWQHARDFDNRNFVRTTKCVFARQLHDEVQGLVGHLGKWVGGVQTHRDQQGLDLALKVAADPLALGCIALVVRQDSVTVALQGGQQFVVVQGILPRNHGAGFVCQGRQGGFGVWA